MANNKMLIDATHPEETRVVVLRNNRVEEFDYESAARKLLRGNIYLAKVTRVEPSLQAAFVDYGGNRHGFLAFNEIHPDYYQIPMADRQALLDEEAAAEAREEAEADARAERLARRQQQRQQRDRGAGNREAARGSRDVDDSAHAPEDMDADEERRDETDAYAADDAGDDADSPRTIAEASLASDDRLSEVMTPAGADDTGEDDAGDEDAGEDDTGEDDEEAASEGSAAAGSARGADQATSSDDNGETADAEPNGDGVEVVAAANPEAEAIEQTGAEDALEELPSRPRRRPRSYKIQEVIKRRQIILVQVVKEERGTKGAALTTYLSLAGRYTVLMPNTARGGGISRKITNPQDRKRLKAIAAALDVPEGMGLIIRTAGAARTQQEIKRDFEYLLRLWESVRDMTLNSTAPSLVYEEGNLIKRSIRDLYDKDVEEVIVAGRKAFEDAHDFMRMLMPSHAKNVHHHNDAEPLFTRYGIERQLNAMFSPYVTLRSGGYLVINQTEALVAVDVNSGKATREFSIEETAYHTNLEAADEIARQLKLRDLAGLIVIDFIDMEEKRNNRSVERRLKDALRFDRARIQLGRISPFGLMEMSRQRMRTGVLEGSTSQCPHCQGTGIIRSTESVALAVLRGLEDALMQGARASLVATTTAQVALYILNNKRQFINDMEARNGVSVTVQASDKLQGANFTIERGGGPVQPVRRPERAAVSMDWGFDADEEAAEGETEEDSLPPAREVNEIEIREDSDSDDDRRGGGERNDDRGGRRRRRRRGRRGNERGFDRGGDRNGERGGQEGGGRQQDRQPRFAPEPSDYPEHEHGVEHLDDDSLAAHDQAAGDETIDAETGEGGDNQPRTAGQDGDRGPRRRRRGRRGGRRGRGRDRERGEGSSQDQDGETFEEKEAAGGQPEGTMAHFTVETVEDFASAEMPPELMPKAATEPREVRGHGRRSERPHRARHQQRSEDARASEAQMPDAAAETASEPVTAHEPVPAAAAPAAVEKPEPAPQPPRRSLSSSSEPKIERVVVRADETSETAGQPAAEAAPPKRGWWQRKLGA